MRSTDQNEYTLVEYPPCLVIARLGRRVSSGAIFRFGLSVSDPINDLLAGLCFGAGVLYITLVIIEMRRHRTTVIPHREADHWSQQLCFNGRVTDLPRGHLSLIGIYFTLGCGVIASNLANLHQGNRL